MKNKTSGILIAITVLVLISLAIGTFVYLGATREQSAIGSGQCVIEESGQKFNSYKCPSDADDCAVTVTLHCDNPTTNNKVVLRWTDEDEEPQEIAYDFDNDGDLDRFHKGDRTLGYYGTVLLNFPYPSTSQIVRWSDDFKVCHPRTGFTSWTCREYESGGTIPITNTPHTSYVGRELTDGSVNTYSCQQSVTGSISQTLYYSGQTPGTRAETIHLNPNQEIFWSDQIKYVESIIRDSACTGKTPGDSSDTYRECVYGVDGCQVIGTENVPCPNGQVFVESSAECGVAYTLDVELDKDMFSPSDNIDGMIKLSGTDKKSFIEIELEIIDLLGNKVRFDTTSTNQNGEADFSIPKLTIVGEYDLRVTASHPDASFTVTERFRVTQPIQLRLAPDPDRVQYNSFKIKAKAFVTDDSGNPKEAKTWDLSGSKCDNQDISGDIQILRIGTNEQGTEYSLQTSISGTCTPLIYKVVAIDQSGVRSDADAINIEVRKAEVIIQPDLEDIQDADSGRRTVSFITLDPNLQPLMTNNRVVVTDSDGCVTGEYCFSDSKYLSEIQVLGSDGQYSFVNDWKDGLNTITITSTAQDISSSTQSFTVNIFPSGIGGGGAPGDPDPDPNNYLGLILGGLAMLAVLGFIFWLIFKKR